ncbi:MAG: flagellar biosynthesis protein FliQ [Pseudomonadota bacterium]
MNADFALTLTNDVLWTALRIAGPILALSMLVGLMISIFQVVTQIQEISLTFVPKMVTVALTLIVLGNWMLGTLIEFSRALISGIPGYF